MADHVVFSTVMAQEDDIASAQKQSSSYIVSQLMVSEAVPLSRNEHFKAPMTLDDASGPRKSPMLLALPYEEGQGRRNSKASRKRGHKRSVSPK